MARTEAQRSGSFAAWAKMTDRNVCLTALVDRFGDLSVEKNQEDADADDF